MTLARAVLAVAVCLAAGGAVGLGVGAAVGRYFPDAIRVQFGRAGEADPFQIGAGLGLIQGAMVGAGVGLGLAAILAWHDARTRRAEA